MNLDFYFQFPFGNWTVFTVFGKYYEIMREKHPEINFNKYCTSDGNNRTRYLNIPGHLFPHLLFIVNPDNGKYYVVSYWDNATELRGSVYGWDDEKKVGLLTSAGTNETVDYIPLSYLPYKTFWDDLSEKSRPVEEKEYNNLFFRGWLYGERHSLHLEGLVPMSNEKILDEVKYYKELESNKINLSINGAAEICHRDMEILAARSVLMRPELHQKFHNDFIPNFHYITFEKSADPKIQSEIIIDKFNEIKYDNDLLKFISENGYEWYRKNATTDANVELLLKLIKIENLV